MDGPSVKYGSLLILGVVAACGGGSDPYDLFESTDVAGSFAATGGSTGTSSPTGAAGSPTAGTGGSLGSAGSSTSTGGSGGVGGGDATGGNTTDAANRDSDGPGPSTDSALGTCGDAGSFPTFDNGCTSTQNCSFGLHQVNCCGTLIAIGFNHAYRSAFDSAEATWRQACPANCSCDPGPTQADDGSFGNAQDVAVRCDWSQGSSVGRCLTYFWW
jgi:hypothetical protein